MSSALIDRFLGSIVKRSQLTLTLASGKKHTLGSPEEGFPEVAIRFTDSRVPRDILLDPRLGAGEAYMDGRIVIEQGDIMQLIQLVRANQPWERGGRLKPPSPSGACATVPNSSPIPSMKPAAPNATSRTIMTSATTSTA